MDRELIGMYNQLQIRNLLPFVPPGYGLQQAQQLPYTVVDLIPTLKIQSTGDAGLKRGWICTQKYQCPCRNHTGAD